MGISNSDEVDAVLLEVGVVLASFLGGRSGRTGEPPSNSEVVLALTATPSALPWLPPSLAVVGGLGRFPSPFAKPPIPSPSGDSLTPVGRSVALVALVPLWVRRRSS